jgi:hypothetical protein
MKKALTLIFILLISSRGVEAQPSPPPHALVFTHVTVVDVSTGRGYADSTVVVQGDRITAVGRRVSIPKDAQVIDASGKFLIPGLWDMHFHAPEDKQAREIFYPLVVANGVTGVRNMFGDETFLKHRAEVASGMLGPRMIVGSPVVDGPVPMWPGSISVADANAGREAVRSIKRSGYDFVKVYQFLPRETYFAIADEAKKQKIDFAGHVPFAVTAVEASDAGQRTFEHIFGVTIACSTQEPSLRPALADAAARVSNGFPEHMGLFIRNEMEPLTSYSDQKADALFRRLARNGTYAVPTLVLHRSLGIGPAPQPRNDERLKYMPMTIRQLFTWELGFFTSSYQPVYQRLLAVTGAMHRAGVKILAGTDTYNAYCFPGFSVHDELELMVEAGMTPLEALQTATLNPAQYLNRLQSLGTVEKGKLADLLLLDANPLEKIGNTRKIAGVVVNGKYLARASLQKMLNDVETIANKN